MEKFIHTCQSEIKTNLVDDLIYAAVHENPFKDHKDSFHDEHKDKDEHILKLIESFGNGQKHHTSDYHTSDHYAGDHHSSDHHSYPNYVENHHQSPEVHHSSHPDLHHPSHPDLHLPSHPDLHHSSGNTHHSSNTHHIPDLSQHSFHNLHPPTHDSNYQSFPPYPPSHDSVHPSIKPHYAPHPLSHETTHHSSPLHSSLASHISPHDPRLPANTHSPADGHQTLAYYIGLAEKLQSANHNLNDKSQLKWHKRSTRGIFFGKNIHHDDKDDYHSKLITHEDQWLAGVSFINYN